MIEQARPGVAYAVEVTYPEDTRPEPEWHTRFGWFPEEPRYREDEPGLKRARRNLAHALESEEYADARIVKRTTEIEILNKAVLEAL